MNTISCIMNLFNKSDIKPRSFLKNEHYQSLVPFEDEFLQDHHLIVASDLFLKEIELLINEISDFNKDKHKIQSLLKKFEEIEVELDERYKSKESMILLNSEDLSNSKLWKSKWKNEENKVSFKILILSWIEESEKIKSLITEIRERKSKVDKKLNELGIFLKTYFLNSKILFNLI
jgi:hypothetical protein